jgi:hypothetical protein
LGDLKKVLIRYSFCVAKHERRDLMSMGKVYQWFTEIQERLPLGKWQALGLAMISLGVVLSERSAISRIAEQLGMVGKADSMERRSQRWLANPRIMIEACCGAWASWVLESMEPEGEQIILLVDLTKLGKWLDVMMVGLAYRKRCIPLAWRCMVGQQSWEEKQVPLIAELLSWIAAAVPEGQTPLVEADRGIGNSSALAQVVAGMNWHFLFRVRDTVRVRLADGHETSLADLIQPGKHWSGTGEVFKKGGWVQAYIHLVWKRSMAEPWCIVTNAPQATAACYVARMWQDEGFRDLKGGGWQWQRSQVRTPDHAERLILALALAYAWTLSLGTRAIRAGKTVMRHITRGHRRTFSAFRLGLRYLSYLNHSRQSILMTLFFRPDLIFP